MAMLKDGWINEKKFTGHVTYTGTDIPVDKNTPESLKTLRWSIYEVIDRYEGDLGKLIKYTLMQEVESLFKEYTNS